MNNRKVSTASIVASPVLVGAVTVLVIVVAVFLGYNANKGLPFIPVYEIKAELPSGANLVTGNEVRLGGFRVGQIDAIRPTTVERDGETESVAVVDLSLDQSLAELPIDSSVIVRTRSALGLKYLELTAGSAEEGFAPGDTIPLANAGKIVEFDDFLNTFNQKNRDDQRTLLTGFGDALAGRGQSINEAVGELPRFLGSLTDVMEVLNDPSTELDELFVQIGAVAEQIAPVADTQAVLFTNIADTFAAINRDPEGLRRTIEETPETLSVGTRSFVVQRPFLGDLAELSRRLRPAVRELPRSLPRINRALRTGEDVLPRTVALNGRVEDTFRALDDLVGDPNTGEGIGALRYTTEVLTPTVRFIAPVNTVCNYGTYFFNRLGEHISEQVNGGTSERIEISFDNFMQDNRLASSESSRPASVPLDESNPYNENAFPLGPATRLNAIVNGPYLTDSGKANCIGGQWGYAKGPISDGARYTNDEDGGHLNIANDNFPRKAPTTFTGVPSLKKVDSGAEFSIRRAP